jgi:hypothetical protein
MSDIVTEALEWAWTNMTGRLPDKNTMSEAEIEEYWREYETILRAAIQIRTGKTPR